MGVYEKTLAKRLKKYTQPDLLVIDEMGHDRLELEVTKERSFDRMPLVRVLSSTGTFCAVTDSSHPFPKRIRITQAGTHAAFR